MSRRAVRLRLGVWTRKSVWSLDPAFLLLSYWRFCLPTSALHLREPYHSRLAEVGAVWSPYTSTVKEAKPRPSQASDAASAAQAGRTVGLSPQIAAGDILDQATGVRHCPLSLIIADAL